MKKPGLTFSLKDVFFREASSDERSGTSRLLEEYGITCDQDDHEAPLDESPRESKHIPPPAGNRLLEKIESYVFRDTEVLEKTENISEPPKRPANRDDLALIRWRKMAGL